MRLLIQKLRQDPEPGPLWPKLLLLFALDCAAVLVACSVAGAVHVRMFNLAVALVAAASAVLSLPTGRRLFARRDTTIAVTPSQPSLDRTKKILILAMCAGAVAYVGGRGTFALFTAETSNSNSALTSGTLVLGNQVGTASTCMSSDGSTLDNINNACDVLVSLPNMAPGVSSAQAKLTIQNKGSLDASQFWLYAPYPRTTLSGALTSGVASGSSLAVPALTFPVASSDVIRVSLSGHFQDFIASGTAAIGATSIPVTSQVANFDYGTTSRVEDRSADTTASNADCYDTKTTSYASVPGAVGGNVLNFVSTTGNPLCASLLLWVQEQTNGKNYCWFGRGSSIGTPAGISTVGQCRTPTTATLSSTLTASSPITSVPVQALTGNVAAGDVFTITEGTHTDTFTANATSIGNAYINDTALTIASWSPNFAYTSAAVIKDTTAFDAMNGEGTSTISNFDTGYKTGIQLYPVTANNTVNTAATVELNKNGNSGYQRIFYVGIYMPAPTGGSLNQLQGLVSRFGLNWHIDQ